MIQTVNDHSWQKSASYQRLSSFEKTLLLSFIRGTTLAAYRKWVEDGKQMPIDEVLALLMLGVVFLISMQIYNQYV